jgi:hypothetical protein
MKQGSDGLRSTTLARSCQYGAHSRWSLELVLPDCIPIHAKVVDNYPTEEIGAFFEHQLQFFSFLCLDVEDLGPVDIFWKYSSECLPLRARRGLLHGALCPHKSSLESKRYPFGYNSRRERQLDILRYSLYKQGIRTWVENSWARNHLLRRPASFWTTIDEKLFADGFVQRRADSRWTSQCDGVHFNWSLLDLRLGCCEKLEVGHSRVPGGQPVVFALASILFLHNNYRIWYTVSKARLRQLCHSLYRISAGRGISVFLSTEAYLAYHRPRHYVHNTSLASALSIYGVCRQCSDGPSRARTDAIQSSSHLAAYGAES